MAVVFVLSLNAGCNNEFQSQLQAVREKGSKSIQLQKHSLTDQDVANIASMDSIEVLQAEKSNVTAAGCEALQKLPKLRRLTLRQSSLSDQSALCLAKISTLETLNLPQADFSDAGVLALTTLPQLRLLRIGSPRATDRIMAEVSRMKSLRFLHLIGIPITDAGLRELESMPHLESLYLDGSQVTHDGLERLISTLPELHLHVDQRHLDIDPRRGHDDSD